MMSPILFAEIQTEHDIVMARHRALQVASLVGFEEQDQTRIATAVSEIARNSFKYAGGGKIEFLVDPDSAPQKLVIRISDEGAGIRDVDRILSGQYKSKTGMGMGIIGARRLMDGFDLKSSSAGTTALLEKVFPRKAPPLTTTAVAELAGQLARQEPEDLVGELQRQNHELLRTLEELQKRQEDLNRLNAELEETNRGVVALYAELDERAQHLKNSDQMKSKFLSHLSHEFRTPLNSILALCRILLDRVDGDLNPEQEKQIQFIRKSGENLFELVNDLLDLAKVEAGKTVVRAERFQVSALFGTLRGMLKPLLQGDSVELIFEEPSGIPPLRTDEGKVAQILRNLISNALKFTEKGEVRVSAALTPFRAAVRFTVRDTGIGIAPEHQEKIFQEFTQIENPLQTRARGTGLGLPLSRKLAELLGGGISVESEPGVGSTFRVTIPLVWPGLNTEPVSDGQPKILVVDDEEVSRYLIRQALGGGSYTVLEARDGPEGIGLVRDQHPSAIFLDLRMPGMTGFEVLTELKADPKTREIPIIIITSKSLQEAERTMLSMNGAAIITKDVFPNGQAAAAIRAALESAGIAPAQSVKSNAAMRL